jgi:hypothetical protein
MLLEANGKASSSNRTKHIRFRYFFIKDRVANGDIAIKHCPTDDMLTNQFTKPLQGGMFRTFRAEIQGIPADRDDLDMGWDRVENREGAVEKKHTGTNPSPQDFVGQDPRLAGDEMRKKYISSHHSKGYLAESVLRRAKP